jgi:hypothetical protein
MTEPIEELHDFTLKIYCGYRSWPDDIEHYCQVTYPAFGSQEPITVDYTHSPGSLDTFIQRAAQDIATYMKDPEEWVEKYVAHSSEPERKLKQAQDRAEEYRKEIKGYQQAIVSDEGRLKEYEIIVAELAELQAKLGKDLTQESGK